LKLCAGHEDFWHVACQYICGCRTFSQAGITGTLNLPLNLGFSANKSRATINFSTQFANFGIGPNPNPIKLNNKGVNLACVCPTSVPLMNAEPAATK
jgi:hypothetical protein